MRHDPLTPAFHQSVAAMNATELRRLYTKIWAYVNRGDGGGWDTPTLRAVHPQCFAALVAVSRREFLLSDAKEGR